MRVELKIKPKHWLLAICIFVGSIIAVALCVYGLTLLLEPYIKWITEYFFHITAIGIGMIWFGFMTHFFIRDIAKYLAKREIRKGGRKWK